MLITQNLAYAHPNKDLLFEYLNLTVNGYDKIALIGNNGAGKSTLLHILAGNLHPPTGIGWSSTASRAESTYPRVPISL